MLSVDVSEPCDPHHTPACIERSDKRNEGVMHVNEDDFVHKTLFTRHYTIHIIWLHIVI